MGVKMYSKYDTNDNRIDFTDCFAYGKFRCNALVEMECRQKGKCKFYTPKHMYIEKLKAARGKNIDI